MDKFKDNDLIAVFGGEICENEKKVSNVTICNVLACGKYDLVVEVVEGSFSRSTHYTVPKSICQKLKIGSIDTVTSDVAQPSIGDLVLSYKRKSYSDEITLLTGILVKVTYRLGQPFMSTMMCDGDLIDVAFSSLVVLERDARS